MLFILYYYYNYYVQATFMTMEVNACVRIAYNEIARENLILFTLVDYQRRIIDPFALFLFYIFIILYKRKRIAVVLSSYQLSR